MIPPILLILILGGINMNNNKESAPEIAGRQYEFADYKKKGQLSSGLAKTHEQVSDGYFEGTIDQED